MPIDRRHFHLAALSLGATATAPSSATGRRGQAPHESSVAELQAAMQSGRSSARAVTAACLARIRAVDQAGPRINAVIELNPEAAAIAAELDRERAAKGPRGPLHGIPVLLKDNIATGDRMRTSAGSLALAHAPAARDAHLVNRLREAGAVILGKTNLSEWANIRSMRSTSGWSTRGGLTRNPHALDRNTSGSSSGSAAAAAAGLAPLTVGTETDGSIVSPASTCGIVGLKPTVGLVSRDGVVPISHSQDTAGPMTRSVADAAALLSVLAGPDARDAATAQARPQDYTRFLDPSRLKGARLGVVRNAFGTHPGVTAAIEGALRVLKAQSAELVDPVNLKHTDAIWEPELRVLLTELKAGLETYLAAYAPAGPLRTLADVIAWNRTHAAREMRWFGQELFEQAQAHGGLEDPGYKDALAASRRMAREEGIDALLAEHKLDALVAPTGGPAWVTDFVNGDHFGASFSTAAAVAGYPHLTVPAGFVEGLPVGLSFVGPAWSEPLLIGLGYAFEQATQARRAPRYLPSVPATRGA